MADYSLYFPPEEPYNSILLMLYDYFAPEEADDENAKNYLIEIRQQLKQLLHEYFKRKGGEDTIKTLVKFLLSGSNYC